MGFFSSFVDGIFGIGRDRMQQEADSDNTWAQINSNERIAQQNLDFQRENLDYQKALQQQIFAREDSSAQRNVADMRKAGLSPLAQFPGSPSANQVVPTEALHNDFEHPGFKPAPSARSLQPFNFLEDIQSFRSSQKQIEGMQLDNEGKRIENLVNASTALSRIDSSTVDSILKRYSALDKREQQAYNSFYGISPNMNDKEKAIAILGTQLGVFDPQGTGSDLRNGLEDLSKPFNSYVNYASPRHLPDEYKSMLKSQLNLLTDVVGGLSNSPISLPSFEPDKSTKIGINSSNYLQYVPKGIDFEKYISSSSDEKRAMTSKLSRLEKQKLEQAIKVYEFEKQKERYRK